MSTYQLSQLYTHQNTAVSLHLIFVCWYWIRDFHQDIFRLGCEIQVQWYELEYLEMLHVHSGPYHVLLNSVNFGREVKSFASLGREFQILGPNVLKLFSTKVVVFALLTTKLFLLLAEFVNFYWNMCAWSLDLRILKS